MKEITTLQKIICVTLDVHLWSGRAKLRASDIKMGDGGELPPDDLASLGSKKIVNPENIAKFEALKKEAERECSRVGIKFLGGFAIPDDKGKELAATLDEIGCRFAQEKQLLLDNYDTHIAEWVASHHGWESTIEGATLNRHEVDHKLQYGWQAFRITNAGEADAPDDVLNKGLATTAKGLSGQLYFEITQAAGQVMEKSLLGRDRLTQKIKSPFRALRSKLHGLSFIDKRVKPLVATIDHVLEQLPAAGPIEGLALTAIYGLTFILSDEERMKKHGELILAGTPVEESFLVSVPQAKKPEELEELEEPDVEALETTVQPIVVETATSPIADLFSSVSEPVVVSPMATEAMAIPAIPPIAKRGRLGVSLFS